MHFVDFLSFLQGIIFLLQACFPAHQTPSEMAPRFPFRVDLFSEDRQHDLLEVYPLHITKTRLFKYIENFTTRNCKFSGKKKSNIFHISAQNKDCGYSLEPPR